MRTINISNLASSHNRDKSYDRGHSVEPKRSYTRQNTHDNEALNRSKNEMAVQDLGYHPTMTTAPFDSESPVKKNIIQSAAQSPLEHPASRTYFLASSHQRTSTSQERKGKNELLSTSLSHRIALKMPLKTMSRDTSPDFNHNFNSPQFDTSKVFSFIPL